MNYYQILLILDETAKATSTAIAALDKKPWGRSKIMIVGEGRAGKTALANSITGQPYRDTASTVGIERLQVQLTCDVAQGVIGSDGWRVMQPVDKEYEAAIARAVLDEKADRWKASDSDSGYLHVASLAAIVVLLVTERPFGRIVSE